MRLIFAGTPVFACAALQKLCATGFEVPLVMTQPDRPAGRGLRLHESPVKVFARSQGISLIQPRSLRLDGQFASDAELARQAIVNARACVMVVAAYGLILPQWILDLMLQPQGAGPSMGCINIHASLLPRWRGAAPIHRAIEAGDAQTGVTTMQMEAGLDTGDMLLTQELSIQHEGPGADTTGSLHDRLAALGAELIVRTLEQAALGTLVPRKQPIAGISYAQKVEKAHAEIEWALGAQQIERRVRAFNPAPGAWFAFRGEVVKLWRSEVCAQSAPDSVTFGTILAVGSHGIDVVCGLGVLRLCELQRAGGKRMDASAFLRGFALQPGMRLGLPNA